MVKVYVTSLVEKMMRKDVNYRRAAEKAATYYKDNYDDIDDDLCNNWKVVDGHNFAASVIRNKRSFYLYKFFPDYVWRRMA